MRGNTIDYTQLGLNHILTLAEIHHNLAVTYLELHQFTHSRSHFNLAITHLPVDGMRTDEKYAIVRAGTPVLVGSCEEVYRPCKNRLENVAQVDHLGQSTVVAALDANVHFDHKHANRKDVFTGFSGRLLNENMIKGLRRSGSLTNNSKRIIVQRSASMREKQLPIIVERQPTSVICSFTSQQQKRSIYSGINPEHFGFPARIESPELSINELLVNDADATLHTLLNRWGEAVTQIEDIGSPLPKSFYDDWFKDDEPTGTPLITLAEEQLLTSAEAPNPPLVFATRKSSLSRLI